MGLAGSRDRRVSLAPWVCTVGAVMEEVPSLPPLLCTRQDPRTPVCTRSLPPSLRHPCHPASFKVYVGIKFQRLLRCFSILGNTERQRETERERERERVGERWRVREREGEREGQRQAGESARDEIETWKNLLPRKFHSAI